MVRRGVYYLVVALLFLTGIALIVLQHEYNHIPWFPSDKNIAWEIEAKISFDADEDINKPVKVSLVLPESQPGFKIVNETTASPDYGYTYTDDNKGNIHAVWTKRHAVGPQVLYYRLEMLADENFSQSMMVVPSIPDLVIPEPQLTALKNIKNEAYKKSSDAFSLTREIFNELKKQDQNYELLQESMSKVDIVVACLNLANISAKKIKALNLEDGRRNLKLDPYIAVFDEKNEYVIFDPTADAPSKSKNLFIWDRGAKSLIDITGGSNSRVTFSIVRNFLSDSKAFKLKQEADKADNKSTFDFSVNNLPIEEQAVFKTILLIPIGVLIVVLLRIIAGLKTSGTFMPILIAMAFLQTDLVLGLIGFISIVGIGLIIRSWLSYLNLLLVARISTVIICVIAIIGFLSFFTYEIGLSDGIKITFFPMIILAWTIERMSILWEEEGYKEVLIQGGGSLLVAVLAYLAMNNQAIQHFTFNYLGLQFVILAIILLVGNYTGYRLSELKRFKPLASEISQLNEGKELEADRLKKEAKNLNKE